MELRKFVLLLLPTLVAFLVGGYGAEIFGHQGFFWPGAIAWGLIIFIIDYNFTMIEKMSFGGVMGRILLVVSSALITATVGDHILFKDTIRNQIEIENAKKEGDKLNNDPALIKMRSVIDRDKSEANKISSKIANYNDELTKECKSGVGEKCKNLQRLIAQENKKLDRLNNRIDKNEEKYDNSVDTIHADTAKKNDRHDIIQEIQALYKYIFSNTVSTVIFVLLSMMVICIETLPLLLKSGKTRKAILRKRQQAMWRTLHRNL